MKIYVCIDGCYDDYRIETVFSTREKAEEWLASRTFKVTPYYDDYDWGKTKEINTIQHGEIEEYDLDSSIPETFVVDCVNMKYDGTVISISSKLCFTGALYFSYKDHINGIYGYFVNIKRTNRNDVPEKEHLIKIANERRLRLIAERIWTTKTGYLELKDAL